MLEFLSSDHLQQLGQQTATGALAAIAHSVGGIAPQLGAVLGRCHAVTRLRQWRGPINNALIERLTRQAAGYRRFDCHPGISGRGRTTPQAQVRGAEVQAVRRLQRRAAPLQPRRRGDRREG